MGKGISSLVAGIALMAMMAGLGEAADARVKGGSPGWGHRGSGGHGGQHHSHPKVVATPPAKVFVPPHHGFQHQHGFSPGFHGSGYAYPYYPSYGYAATYVAPSYGQWVPGYWSYVWVPQAATTRAWVPGYYDRDGVWVAGYFSAEAVQGGYYQPYWVSGYWSP
jgi:hypothetical protein